MSFKHAVLSLALLAAGAAPSLAETTARWTPKSGDVVRFNVLREGKPFGSHTVKFSKDADGNLTAQTDVSLKAGLGPVTLFRYTLDATETWVDGKLVAVTGAVNDDGKKRSVKAVRKGAGLAVDGTDFKGTAPAGIIPASHWNFAQTRAGKLLSTEDGEILDVKVSEIGREQINAGGQKIEANHYRLDSAIDVDLWYDDEGRWVKLAFEARGQEIEYVLDKLY
ncbi:MAG: hypothetical protein IPK75_16335 [Acidobacteria bacterium]|jgi:hypothetical protein|nr:hypothetical protein [Acidobacteriota bacterium]